MAAREAKYMSEAPVLVTGARGFVGKWLLEALRHAMPGTPVVATSTQAAEADVQLDVTNADAVSALVAHLQPRAIVNLAALSFVPDAEADPKKAYAVNLFGPMHIAHAIMSHSPACRFVFVGSSEIYGATFRSTDKPLEESAPLDPMNIYAASKAAADLLMANFAHHGLQVVRFRPFNHFGPGQSSRFVIPAFVQQIVAGEASGKKSVIRVGNIDTERDFVDVRDVVAAYVAAILRPQPLPAGTVLNLASGIPRSIRSILVELIAHARIEIEIEYAQDRVRSVEMPRAIGNPSLVRRLLGWTPTHPFDQTLREVLDVARAQQSPNLIHLSSGSHK